MATVVKGHLILVKNTFDKAVEWLELEVCRRRREVQRETPNVDTAEALKQTIKSLIDEGVEVEQFKEPGKHRQSRDQEKNSDERTPEEMTRDLVDTMGARFLEEQNSARE